jgi:hypothetical protein
MVRISKRVRIRIRGEKYGQMKSYVQIATDRMKQKY